MILTSCALTKPVVPNQAGRIAAERLSKKDPELAALPEHTKQLRNEGDEEVMKAPARDGSGFVGEVDIDQALLPKSKGSKAKGAASAVKLDFVDASLKDVVIAFMDYLKQPFNFQDSFKDRKVNLFFEAKATREELTQLFDTLLENYGVKLRYGGGVYYVGSSDDKGAPLQQPSPIGVGDSLGVFRLNFIEAREFQTLAKQITKYPDKIGVLPGNVVVVNSTGTDVRAVRSLREDVDIPAFAGKFVLVYAPRYLSAASLVALLDNALAQLAGGGAAQGGNKQYEAKQVPETERIVIVAANKTARDLVIQLLAQSDVAGANYRRVFQYVLGTQSAVDIVANLSVLVKSVIKSPGEINIVPDKMSNSLFIYASPEEYVEIRKLLVRMDFRPPAVQIDMVIAEVTLTNAMRYGVEWFLKKSGRWLADADTRLGFNVATTGGIGVGIIDAVNNFATLQLLGSETSFSLLSSPKLVVRNGATAKIAVGSEQPVIKTKTNSNAAAGVNTVIEPEYKKIGLEMEVTPFVSSSNEVRILIKLKDTSITGTVPLAGDNYPILANRELNTDLVTADGRTIFLGGIRRQQANDSMTKVPGAGDLPVVGAAFRNKSIDDSGSELIILATATVILDQQGADAVTRALIRASRQSMRDLRLGDPALPEMPVKPPPGPASGAPHPAGRAVPAAPFTSSANADSALRLQIDTAPNMATPKAQPAPAPGTSFFAPVGSLGKPAAPK